MPSLPNELNWLDHYFAAPTGSVQKWRQWGGVGQLFVRQTDGSPGSGVDLKMTVLQAIAIGGMGVTLLVMDPRNGDGGLRVCKVVKPGASTQKFDEEARLLASIDHPNVVRYLGDARLILPAEVGSPALTHSLPVFLMDFVPGGSLRDVLKLPRQPDPARTRRVPVREALRVTSQIVQGLKAIHDAKIIHRDIKPANILLDISDGRSIRICDLGVAKESPHPGAAHTVTGTPGYIAPEILAGGVPTEQADFFSVGCILAQMLTGRPAFSSSILATEKETPAGLQDIEKKYKSMTRTLVADLLQKSPADRPVNHDQILSRIETLLGSDLRPASSWWKSDWPDYDRHRSELLEFVAEEKQWFQSGKIMWAGCLIGLHARRRTLTDFSQLLTELQNRLFSLAESLTPIIASQDSTTESFQLTYTEYESGLAELSSWLLTRLSNSLQSGLNNIGDDRHLLKKFQRVLKLTELFGTPIPSRPRAAWQSMSAAQATELATQRIELSQKCWHLCRKLERQVQDSISDCSDQLVAAVAQVK